MLQWTWGYRHFPEILIWILVDVHSEVKLLGHIFKLLWTTHSLFHSGCIIWHSLQQCTSLPFLHLVTNTCYLLSFIIAILTGVWWYLVVVFLCISLMTNVVEHFFHVPVGYLNIFFGKISILVLYPFFKLTCLFLLMSFMSSSDILGGYPSSNPLILQIFSLIP